MGGRWSLVQIQSPRPLFSVFPRGVRAAPKDASRSALARAGAFPGPLKNVPLMIAAVSYRVAEWIVRRLPRGSALALGIGVARLAFAIRVPARRALETNLAGLLGTRVAVGPMAREAFEQFARGFVEFLALGGMDRAHLAAAVEFEGGEHLAAARASGRGVIVLSAHVGNWEWGAAALAACAPRLHLIARRHGSAAVEAMFEHRRRAFGIERLCGRPLWSDVARLLRQRGWVAMMGDRAAPGARHSVCAWAAAMARRTGAIVLPAFTVRREDGRYTLVVEPALSAEACAAGGYRDAMRRHLVRHAGQWCAFERLPEAIS